MSVVSQVRDLVRSKRLVGRVTAELPRDAAECAAGLVGSLPRGRLKPQDLVAFLLRHRAELRIGPPPPVRIRISVFTPAGRPAVEIGFGQAALRLQPDLDPQPSPDLVAS